MSKLLKMLIANSETNGSINLNILDTFGKEILKGNRVEKPREKPKRFKCERVEHFRKDFRVKDKVMYPKFRTIEPGKLGENVRGVDCSFSISTIRRNHTIL